MMFYKEINFKETPIGNIPEDWKAVKLEAILNLRNGKRPRISENGNIPVFGANGIMGYTTRFLTDNDFTIIVGRVGASGRVHLGKGKIWISDNAIYGATHDKSKASMPFMYRLLESKNLERFASKTTHPIITQTFLKNFVIQLPMLVEQQRINEVLSVVDLAVQKTDELIAKSERLKKGLMRELLIKGVGHTEFKDTQIGRVPKAWEVKTLIDVVEGKRDSIVAGPFGSNLKVIDYRDEGIPIIRLQNVEYCRFVNKDIKYISLEKAEELKYHSFVKGDIILAKLGIPIGKTCIVPSSLEKGIVVADVVRIRVNEQIINKKYVMYALNSFYVSNQLKKETIGTTRPRVNLKHVRNLLIAIPPLKEQQKIAEILSLIEKKLELERKEKGKLEGIKQGLMDLLLNGKVRVRVE